jgi:hypothetical protein
MVCVMIIALAPSRTRGRPHRRSVRRDGGAKLARPGSRHVADTVRFLLAIDVDAMKPCSTSAEPGASPQGQIVDSTLG